MATTTLPLSTKDMKDTKIRYGNAVLITYPETSPFAGTYHAYAVKTWKHKTKVLWSDAGLYQYTTTIIPNKFIRKDSCVPDINPRKMKAFIHSLIQDNNLCSIVSNRLKKEMMEWGRKKKIQQKEEVVGKKKNKKRKKYDVEINTTLSKMLNGELTRLHSIGQKKIQHASLFKKSKRQRSTELPSTKKEFPQPLSFDAFRRACLLLNSDFVVVSSMSLYK
jgi:hypothetical protein